MHYLFHRSTPWSSSIQCSTKTYARLFADAGSQVTYLQDLANPAHLLLRKGYYSTWKEGCRQEDGVWVVAPLGVIPDPKAFGRFSPGLATLPYRSCVPSIRHLVSKSGYGSPDVVWSTKPGSAALKRIYPDATFIMNVVDYYPAFHGDKIRLLEKHDYEVCDHVFVIGHTLQDYLNSELGIPLEKITVLGQGVRLERYQQAAEKPDDLRLLSGPIAVWVGVLNKADRGLMTAAASAMAEVGGSVILIGPPSDWETELVSEFPNVRFLGPKASEEVSSYLMHSAIGLMLYDRSRQEVYRGQNPLKLYEYLAAGLSVVSTDHDEYRFLKPPTRVVSNELEVRQAIHQAIDERQTDRHSAINFAANRDWKKCKQHAQEVIESIRTTTNLTESSSR